MARARIDVSGVQAADADPAPITAGKIGHRRTDGGEGVDVNRTHVDLGERKIVVVVEDSPSREPWSRVRIVAYKVKTSQGRFLSGDLATLPGSEAETLVTEGKAKPA